MDRNKLNKNNGITLIALVITIIVMLILVAVTISMAINGGLFEKAGKATGDTKNAINAEQKLANGAIQIDGVWYDSIDDYLNGKPSTGGGTEKLKIELSIAGTKATTIPIPDGFEHVEGTTIDTGYVIKNTSDGNEFVWVPVEKDQKITLNVTSEKDITEVKLYDPYGDEILTVADGEIETTYSNTNIEPTINGMYIAQVTTEDGIEEKTLVVRSLYALDTYNDWNTSEECAKMMAGLNKDQFWEAFATQVMGAESLEVAIRTVGCGSLDQFITILFGQQTKKYEDLADYTESVKSNGGFYIGRYEAGATTVRTSGNDSDPVDAIKAANGIPVSKEGYAPYIYVTFDQALGLAESMYSSSVFEVRLLTGAAWDRTLGWIYETTRKNITEIAGDSGSWGNYYYVEFEISKGKYSENNGSSYTAVSGTYKKAKEKSVLLTTGATTRNAVNNIFDLAGNVAEWTGEVYSSTKPTARGVSSGSDISSDAPAGRGLMDPFDCYSDVGFRTALYIR